MTQFRLTQKFAKDLKCAQLLEPVDTSHPLDDWFIDVLRVGRQKFAMATHGKSTYTFFISYVEAGGAKKIPEFVGVLLRDFLLKNAVLNYIDDVELLFNSEPRFCKTNDRRILGHMNDFKRCGEYPLAEDGTQVAEQIIADMPVRFDGDYSFPIELLGKVLNCPDKLLIHSKKYNFK